RGHKVMPPLQLHVDVAPRHMHLVARAYQAVEYPGHVGGQNQQPKHRNHAVPLPAWRAPAHRQAVQPASSHKTGGVQRARPCLRRACVAGTGPRAPFPGHPQGISPSCQAPASLPTTHPRATSWYIVRSVCKALGGGVSMDSTDMRRRAFLKTVPAVAVGLATLQSSSAGGAAPTSQAPIAEASFPRGRDYPMRPLPFWDVTLKDDFWAPKVRRNAEVTVPFEISKLGVVGDGLEGGVLEAAIYIARSRPDLHMQDYIERCLQPMLAAPTAGYEHRQFEIGAALWFTHGDRRLIDKCLPQAAALEREFREQDPPYPGGERPSMSCAFLYRVTRDPRHLALAKHYLDIRGRADSPGRSRHTQSWLPVLEQREAAGHAVN